MYKEITNVIFGEGILLRGTGGLKRENRGRRPRFSFKGGEEKSPYGANFSIGSGRLLDGESTIALLLFDKI
jgi:hypothetical protein